MRGKMSISGKSKVINPMGQRGRNDSQWPKWSKWAEKAQEKR